MQNLHEIPKRSVQEVRSLGWNMVNHHYKVSIKDNFQHLGSILAKVLYTNVNVYAVNDPNVLHRL